jgi:hypothetical protein
MTEQQLDALVSLAKRYNSGPEWCDVLHDPFGLPDGWISVVVFERGTPPGKGTQATVKIVAGIDPSGRVHA